MKIINLILLLTLAASCGTVISRKEKVKLNPVQLHQKTVEDCVHRFVDKGVLFTEASTSCSLLIYKERKI